MSKLLAFKALVKILFKNIKSTFQKRSKKIYRIKNVLLFIPGVAGVFGVEGKGVLLKKIIDMRNVIII